MIANEGVFEEVAVPASQPGKAAPKYPGIRVTCNGNQLVTEHVETRITEGGVFYPITPSTEGGEIYQQSYAQGELNVFGQQKIAIECEGEHAAQGGATAYSVAGRRTVNFTSGQGIVYAMEQYYHAPGKLSTMVLEVGARALTKHALNVHCGHDDFYAALDTGWTMLVGKDAQQASDHAMILRKVNELSLNPGMNIQDGMLTTHSERTYLAPEAELLREYLGAPDEMIDCPTPAQRELFGPKRRRVPEMMDLKNPILLGPVQNQEHHMNGVVARRNNFNEPILKFLEQTYEEFGHLTGRYYHLVTEYKTEDADTVFVSLGCAAENIEAGCDYLRGQRKDGRGSVDGETYFVLGVDHPYAVISKDTPSLLPDKAIAVRFHSIGGWGMITTGKNLGSIIGDFGSLISEQDPKYDADGQRVEKLFVMANPKYGSEKKGAPTNYYLTVAPEPIRVNCELNHVDVVLCCDPKAFTHTNPFEGLNKGGCLVRQSSDTPEPAWQPIPAQHRKFVRENNIRVYILPGFEIARKATDRGDLQLRMKGNSSLGSFFPVSPFLENNNISEELFHETVRNQYEKKFGRFGEAVVTSNMEVMHQGFSRVEEIKYGEIEDPDRC